MPPEDTADGVDRRDFLAAATAFVGAFSCADLFAKIAEPGGEGFTITDGALDLTTDDTAPFFAAHQALIAAEEAGDKAAIRRSQKAVEEASWHTEVGRFTSRLDEVFRAAPAVDSLRIDNLMSLPSGSRLDAAALVACPHMARIRRLILTACNIGPKGAIALANSPHLRCLTDLSITADAIGDDGLAALARSPHLANLEMLYLQGTFFGPKGVGAVATSPHMARLMALILSGTEFGDEGAIALARSPTLRRLRVLLLNDNRIGPAGAKALIASTGFRELRDLCIMNQRIGSAMRPALEERFGGLLYFDNDKGDDFAAEEAWTRAALRRPDDDTPRLAAAERLDAEGDPRGELIRIQCGLTRLPEYEPSQGLAAIEANLLAAHGAAWRVIAGDHAPFYEERPPDMDSVTCNRRVVAHPTVYFFRRGVIDRLHASARKFAWYAEGLFRGAPALRSAILQCGLEAAKHVESLARSPYIARLTELELHGLDDEKLAALARSPHLKRLRSLKLEGRLKDGAALAAWLASPGLAGLTSLDLSGVCLDDEALSRVAAAWPRGLTSLDTSGSWVGDEGAEPLASMLPSGLTRLGLRNTGLGDEGAIALAGAASLSAPCTWTRTASALTAWRPWPGFPAWKWCG